MERVKVLEREVIRSGAVSTIIWVTSFVMLTAFGAWVKIPIPGTPVPITLQTLFVLLGGAMLGMYGGLAQLIYVMLGSFGLPIFACGIGLLGPTGGYLIGFIVASTVVGAIIRRKSSFNWIVFSMIIGTVIIYLFGMLQLGLFLPNGFKTMMALGVLPFIPGDIVKLFIASIIYYKVGSYNGMIRNGDKYGTHREK